MVQMEHIMTCKDDNGDYDENGDDNNNDDGDDDDDDHGDGDDNDLLSWRGNRQTLHRSERQCCQAAPEHIWSI